jgi:hypothetical protein
MFTDTYVNSIHLQPKSKSLPENYVVQPYKAGTGASKDRLIALQFDPIAELVISHRRLENEIERMEQWRDGGECPMTSDGKRRAYRPEVHHALYTQLSKISESLLRYGYGRVSEVAILQTQQISPLVITLSDEDFTEIANG